MKSLIYGKNPMDRIVAIEPGNETAEIFRELIDGSIESVRVPNSQYILYSEQYSPKMKGLSGDQFYRYMMEYQDLDKYHDVLSSSYKKRLPLHVIRDPKEALMCKDGYTYFKGLKIEDVSVLSFDIETTGLNHDSNSEVLLISNTFRKNGQVIRKLFSVDEYDHCHLMIHEWCCWVREMNPSIIAGHNIFRFDLPYLEYCSRDGLHLGRDISKTHFASRNSQFRKDGSQSYDYNNALIYGREIVDTWFLSMKYDTAARKEYESYGLKYIVQREGLEKKGRTFYDASKIRANWHDPKEREKIKAYAIDDADDALALYDLMIPSQFYWTQSCPRSLQAVVNSASGSQVNSLMIRGYLQQGHSIAVGGEKVDYAGAISFGVPGIHKNVFKIDVQSLYPSIILAERLYNKTKDPQALFLQLVDFFTQERIQNKERFEKTGERYFSDLSDSQKIMINSAYGFLGAPKLNYHSPDLAARVTEVGREILKKSILWASGKEYIPILEDDGDENEVA